MNWNGVLRWVLLNAFVLVILSHHIYQMTKGVADPVERRRKVRRYQLSFSPLIPFSIYLFYLAAFRDCRGSC